MAHNAACSKEADLQRDPDRFNIILQQVLAEEDGEEGDRWLEETLGDAQQEQH